MNPPRGGRRFNLLRRGLALASCLGPVSHVVAVGRRDDPPTPALICEPYRKPDFAPPRDDAIGIVGLGYYTDAVVSVCEEAGLPVGFLVDDREGADGDRYEVVRALAGRGIPLLSMAEFAGRARRTDGGLMLVAGRVDCQLPLTLADDPYRQVAAWVARTVPGQDAPLHPAALLARIEPLLCPNRYAVFGFPGSGNILTQNLAEALVARRPDPVPKHWQVRAGLSEQFFYGFVARVETLLAPLTPTRVEFIPYDFGTMRVSVECGGRAGVALHVPSQRHLGLPAYPTHSRTTRAAVEFFASVAAPCVAVVRHPLETLLSGANKILRPSRPVLDDSPYLDQATAQLADWTTHLLAHRDRVHVVRYEDLAARRIDVLRGLAAFLGQPLADDEAEGLFDRFLNRNLFDAPAYRDMASMTAKHFYRGGSDKWRGEFEPRDLRRILARLPAEAFTAFGYEVPTEADLSPVPFNGAAMPKSELYACLLESYPRRPVPGTHGIEVCGSDEAMVAGLTAAFSDPALLAHLAVGGLSGVVPPASAFA